MINADDHGLEYPEPHMGKKISEAEQMDVLIRLATKKMKDDHQMMMRKMRWQLLLIVILIAVAIAYEMWGIPFLECKWLGICR